LFQVFSGIKPFLRGLVIRLIFFGAQFLGGGIGERLARAFQRLGILLFGKSVAEFLAFLPELVQGVPCAGKNV